MKNSDDPTSIYYDRKYNKEPINKKRLTIIIISDILLTTIVYLIFHKLLYIFLFNIIYYLFLLKYVLIFIVKMYQKIAPISIREKCRFEPSCSNYMLQCLEKYGLFKGFKKGINRLKRCNINGGGYDYP